MTKIVAAIDGSPVGRTVIAAASALAEAIGSTADVVHVHDQEDASALATAEAGGLELRVLSGDVVEALVQASGEGDVMAVVVGARRDPDGARPAGHVALSLLTDIIKPLVVVPPNSHPVIPMHRMLVPLDGTSGTAERVRPLIDLAKAAGLEVVVIHVCDEDRIPCFTEQPQHETQAFTEEFLARYAPGVDAQLELRVGVPAPALSTAVRALDADLLAVAWAQVLEHGHAEVVKQLLAESPVPVIFVPR